MVGPLAYRGRPSPALDEGPPSQLRVQLAGTNYLSLAEVQVFGVSGSR